MKTLRILSLLAAAILGTVFVSCKKDSDDEEEYDASKYVTGNLSFKMPAYVKYGDVISLNPIGAHTPSQKLQPDGTYKDIVGYYFVNPFTENNDTTKYDGAEDYFPSGRTSKVYDFKISKDTLGTLSLVGYAYYVGLYSLSATYSFTIVSDEKSITGVKSYPDDGVVTVEGVDYPTATIGGKEWMRKNLVTSAGTPFSDCQAMTNLYGKYYTWEEAQTVCPAGWTLPSPSDWEAVLSASGNNVSALFADAYFNGSRMWTFQYQVGTITDSSHLSILPCGYGMIDNGDCYFVGNKTRAAFWTSGTDGDNGEFVEFHETRNGISTGCAAKTGILFNVRCVKKQ